MNSKTKEDIFWFSFAIIGIIVIWFSFDYITKTYFKPIVEEPEVIKKLSEMTDEEIELKISELWIDQDRSMSDYKTAYTNEIIVLQNELILRELRK